MSKQESRKSVLQYSPSWLQTVVYVVGLYAFFNFFFTTYCLLEGGTPQRLNDELVLASHGKVIRKLTPAQFEKYEAYVARILSGTLILFSSASLMILIASRAYRRATHGEGPETKPGSEIKSGNEKTL